MNLPKKEACFQSLRQRILTMSLAPGTELDEVTLSDEFGLSRTPLREILQRLSGGGYLELRANRGAKVSSLDVATLRVFFQTAPMIYANISRLAATNSQPEGIARLRGVQAEFAAAARQGASDTAALANHAFHAAIGQMAQNPYLVACLDRLLIDHTRLGQTFYRPENEEQRVAIVEAIEQHEAMISAIEGGDAEEAVRLTLQHWDLSCGQIERFVRPDPLPIDVPGAGEMSCEV